MRIPIVNEKDEIILSKRDKVAQEDVYRVSSLWITNSKKEILLARRALNKRNDPGKMGTSCSGYSRRK